MICVRAISPDDETAVRKVVDLFKECYGDNFPVKNVYEPHFWKTHIGTRICSILAMDGTEALAHIAVYPDNLHKGSVQLAFAACKDSCLSKLPLLWQKAKKMILKSAAYQEWSIIYFFALRDDKVMLRFGTDLVKAKECAFCPEYYPASRVCWHKKESGKREEYFFNRRTDVTVLALPLGASLKEKTLFIPPHHKEFLKELVNSFNLKRKIETADLVDAVENKDLENKLYSNTFLQIGLTQHFVTAATKLDIEYILRYEEKHKGHSFVFVDLTHPLAISNCSRLEEIGAKVCGYFPGFRGSDYLVMVLGSLAPVDDKMYNSETTKKIVRYLQNQNRESASALAAVS